MLQATSGNASICDPSHPAGQDCHYGRDKAAADGTLTKTGGSTLNNGIANGFDYTKVCNSGQLAGQGTCPADPALGAGADDWACTKDNVTGLIWEVKTTSGLRNQNHTYTWFNTNSPDGNPGTSSGRYTLKNNLAPPTPRLREASGSDGRIRSRLSAMASALAVTSGVR